MARQKAAGRCASRTLHSKPQYFSRFSGGFTVRQRVEDVVLSGLALSVPMSQTAKSVSELAALVGGQVLGDPNAPIQRVASLDNAGEGEIAYVEDEKFFEAAKNSHASCVIVPENSSFPLPCQIAVRNPKLAFALIDEVLHPPKQREPEIHQSAVIAETEIGR